MTRTPSGLFPGGPPHPNYREPHPVRGGPIAAGAGAGALWMLLFGLLSASIRSYAWLTLVAGAVAWGTALVLARLGDRGVAVGVAVSVGAAWSIAALVVGVASAVRGWPLW